MDDSWIEHGLFTDDPDNGDLANQNAFQKMSFYAALNLPAHLWQWVPIYHAARGGWLLFARRL